MTGEDFDRAVREQLARCTETLCCKAQEYATADRLHNFKKAAALQGVTAAQALAGMMAKHTVSVYDMIADGQTHPAELWREKLTDSINYLLLLSAMVEAHEDGQGPTR